MLAGVEASDPVARLEAAVLGTGDALDCEPVARQLVRRLGGSLPGAPMGVPEADAGLAVALLRLVPERWAVRDAALAASEKASQLLLADHAAGLHPSYEGLAWMLLGEIGA